MKTLTVLLLQVLIVLPGLKSNCQETNNKLFNWKSHTLDLAEGIINTNAKDLISKPGKSEDYLWIDFWYHTANNIYTYDDKGVLIENFRTLPESTDTIARKIWTYDNYDNLTEYLFQMRNNNVWEIFFGAKYLYTYNDAGNVLETVYQLWNTDNWENYIKTEYTIGIQGEWIEYVEYLWENESWINNNRFTDIVWHNWDKLQLQNYTKQEWNNEWVNTDRFSYTYTGNNYTAIREVFINDDWVLNERETYTITATEETDLFEHYDNGTWINNERYSVFYNELGAVVRSKIEKWEDNTWLLLSSTRYLLTYNENNDIVEKICQYWDNVGQTWDALERFLYSNFQYFELGVEEYGSGLQVNIYPNPVTGTITFDFNGEGESEKMVKIFSVAGQNVYEEKLTGNQNKIDLGILPKGMYILRIISNDDRVINKKILKL